MINPKGDELSSIDGSKDLYYDYSIAKNVLNFFILELGTFGISTSLKKKEKERTKEYLYFFYESKLNTYYSKEIIDIINNIVETTDFKSSLNFNYVLSKINIGLFI